MSLTLIDPLHLNLTASFSGGLLRVAHAGTTLPVADQSIVCEVGAGVQVPCSVEFTHSDPSRTLDASHDDAAGQSVSWSGSNPRQHTFGLTGGFVDVELSASADSETKITIIKIKIKPKTDKPFGA